MRLLSPGRDAADVRGDTDRTSNAPGTSFTGWLGLLRILDELTTAADEPAPDGR